MSRSKKLDIQIKQLKSILTDYSKMLQSCKSLSQQLNKSFTLKKDYEEAERQINLKIKIVDSAGIGKLRQKIIQKYTELMDYEHDLKFQYERNIIKKQVESASKTMKKDLNQQKRNQNQLSASPERQKQTFEDNKKGKKSDNQLPFYLVKNDFPQNKLDSISKFVASLKRSMKIQAEGSQHSKLQQFLQTQDQYKRIRQEIQRYKTMQQELAVYFNKKVREQVARRIQQQHEILSETNNYKLIKVIKQPTEAVNSKDQQAIELSQDNFDEKNFHQRKSDGQQLYSPSKRKSKEIEQKLLLSQVKKRVEEDFEEIKLALNIQTEKYEQILQKCNEDFGQNEEALKKIKSKRKKNFVCDDIWDEVADI